jgi:hypothetical protein
MPTDTKRIRTAKVIRISDEAYKALVARQTARLNAEDVRPTLLDVVDEILRDAGVLKKGK